MRIQIISLLALLLILAISGPVYSDEEYSEEYVAIQAELAMTIDFGVFAALMEDDSNAIVEIPGQFYRDSSKARIDMDMTALNEGRISVISDYANNKTYAIDHTAGEIVVHSLPLAAENTVRAGASNLEQMFLNWQESLDFMHSSSDVEVRQLENQVVNGYDCNVFEFEIVMEEAEDSSEQSVAVFSSVIGKYWISSKYNQAIKVKLDVMGMSTMMELRNIIPLSESNSVFQLPEDYTITEAAKQSSEQVTSAN
jgi:hypothetical protein